MQIMSLIDMVDKLLKREDNADKQLMEFEERRLKFEEQMEEQRRIREQEHEKEMQMMFLQLMQQAMHGNAYASYIPMPTYESDIWDLVYYVLTCTYMFWLTCYDQK